MADIFAFLVICAMCTVASVVAFGLVAWLVAMTIGLAAHPVFAFLAAAVAIYVWRAVFIWATS